MNLIERYTTRTISSGLISIGIQLRIIESEFEEIDIKAGHIVTVVDILNCSRECTICSCGRRRLILNRNKAMGNSCFATLETLDGRLVVD